VFISVVFTCSFWTSEASIFFFFFFSVVFVRLESLLIYSLNSLITSGLCNPYSLLKFYFHFYQVLAFFHTLALKLFRDAYCEPA